MNNQVEVQEIQEVRQTNIEDTIHNIKTRWCVLYG